MSSRRHFLKTTFRGASLIALAPTIPGFLARTAQAAPTDPDGRILVVIQLDGGNDGINTVVPFGDDAYGRARKVLRLPTERLIKVSDGVGLHPGLVDAAKLFDSGLLAIVQGVGYPNPSRSHFRSMAIWQTARLDPEEHGGPGWIGRVGDEVPAAGAIYLGSGTPPAALRGRRAMPTSMDRVEDLTIPATIDTRAAADAAARGGDLSDFVRRSLLDAYTTADRLAEMTRQSRTDDLGVSLAGRLNTVARLIKTGSRARIYYADHGGYDTHAQQLQTHASLLIELGYALHSFFDELTEARLADRVIVLCFSEFGRRVAENGSAGTDHGTAGPVFLAGPRVRPGLIGTTPSLADLDANGDLKWAIDFRRIYATILDHWLNLPPDEFLGGHFDALPVLKA